MGSIFGGSKQKSRSTSYNKAYPFIQEQFGGVTDLAGTGANALSALLAGDTSGLDTYLSNSAYDFEGEQGARGITANRAAQGILNSGGTGKKYVEYGNDLRQRYIDNYYQKLLGQAQLGLGAGQLITGAGQTGESQSKGKSKGGLGGLIGGGLSVVARSERALKKNITEIGKNAEGIPIYRFWYKTGSGPHIGTMVEDVERLKPEALGPITKEGHRTVDYSKISLEVV